MTKNRIYWIFTIAVIAALTIPTLVQEGMFLDGITYSAVSKNMANGYGTSLAPHYTKTLYPEFHEQPPLILIIQSWFFSLFGNVFYTERIFSLFILILSVIGISQWLHPLGNNCTIDHTLLEKYQLMDVKLKRYVVLRKR